MRIRKAEAKDMASVVALAESCGLDYPGMESDVFWIAEEENCLLGICGLKTHPDCRELCALGVRKELRGKGIGRELVNVFLRETGEEIFLATVIPEFFTWFGFARTARFPLSMRKGGDWCEGCDSSRCVVMVRRSGS